MQMWCLASPSFVRSFHATFVGNGDQKKFTKNPRLFSMQNSRQTRKKYSLNVSGEQAHSKNHDKMSVFDSVLDFVDPPAPRGPGNSFQESKN